MVEPGAPSSYRNFVDRSGPACCNRLTIASESEQELKTLCPPFESLRNRAWCWHGGARPNPGRSFADSPRAIGFASPPMSIWDICLVLLSHICREQSESTSPPATWCTTSEHTWVTFPSRWQNGSDRMGTSSHLNPSPEISNCFGATLS